MSDQENEQAKERRLDVSMLEPCEPMERALQALQELASGEYLCLQHRQEPHLLYPMLERAGMGWYTRHGEQTAWEVLIYRQQDTVARAAVAAVAQSDGMSLAGG